MEQLEITDESELTLIAQKALSRLAEATPDGAAAVLALSGDLGAGKTAFTKALAVQLGVEEEVNSPTFVLLKYYACAKGPYEVLAHIDAYRVDDLDEMRPLRFGELLKQEKTLICIEWAEKIRELLPPHTVFMDIEIHEDARTITIA